MAPVFVAPADATTAQIVGVAAARRSASPVRRSASSPATSTTSRSSRRGGGARPTSGPTPRRRRRGDRRRGGAARHVSRATASALRLPAEPPDTKQPPAPSGSPASERSQSSAALLGGDRATGLLPALARERPGADEGVEQRGRRRRRGRDVGEEAAVVEGDVVRQQHVVDERQRRVDPDARRRDGARGRRRRPASASARAAASGAKWCADPRRVSSSASRAWSRRPAVERPSASRLAGSAASRTLGAEWRPPATRRPARIAPDLRRRQIVEATHPVTLARGLHDLRVADVADELDVSTGLIHYHFATKDELIEAMLGEMAEREIAGVRRSIERLATPEERLARVDRRVPAVVAAGPVVAAVDRRVGRGAARRQPAAHLRGARQRVGRPRRRGHRRRRRRPGRSAATTPSRRRGGCARCSTASACRSSCTTATMTRAQMHKHVHQAAALELGYELLTGHRR